MPHTLSACLRWNGRLIWFNWAFRRTVCHSPTMCIICTRLLHSIGKIVFLRRLRRVESRRISFVTVSFRGWRRSSCFSIGLVGYLFEVCCCPRYGTAILPSFWPPPEILSDTEPLKTILQMAGWLCCGHPAWPTLYLPSECRTFSQLSCCPHILSSASFSPDHAGTVPWNPVGEGSLPPVFLCGTCGRGNINSAGASLVVQCGVAR